MSDAARRRNKVDAWLCARYRYRFPVVLSRCCPGSISIPGYSKLWLPGIDIDPWLQALGTQVVTKIRGYRVSHLGVSVAVCTRHRDRLVGGCWCQAWRLVGCYGCPGSISIPGCSKLELPGIDVDSRLPKTDVDSWLQTLGIQVTRFARHGVSHLGSSVAACSRN